MTILGLAFVFLGGLGLVAGLAGLAVTRLDEATADRLSVGQLRRYRRQTPLLAPVFMVGLVLIDARPIPDALGVLLLAAALLAIIVTVGVLVANKVRERGSMKWAIVLGVVEALLITSVIVLAVETADLLSVLILFGLALVLLGLVAAVVGVVWFVISLIRRRRRRAVAARFVWASISVVAIGLLGVAPTSSTTGTRPPRS